MGLISRVKTWILQEDVSSSDLNGEFDNIISQLDGAHIVGDSATVAQMQTQTSPGAVGSESLATNVSGEVERLRYVIQRFLGNGSPYWYSAPVTDLTTIKSSLPNLAQLQNGVVSGAVDANGQPMFLVPSGTTNAATLKASVTPLVCYINGTLTTFSSDITISGLSVAPAANNTALIDKNPSNGPYVVNASSKCSGEPDSNYLVADAFGDVDVYPIGNYLLLKTVGSSIAAQNENLIAFKLNAEYSIGVYRNGGLTRLEDCVRGCFFDNTNSAIPRVGFADGDTVTLEQVAFIFVLIGGTLDVTYNQPKVGAQPPSSPVSGNYWYDTANNLWKKYNGTSFISTPACYLGMTIQNTTACVAARSTDLIGAYSDQNGILLRRDATTNSRVVAAQTGLLSVYGQTVGGFGVNADFSTARDIDGSLAAGDLIFFYVSKNGKQAISNIAPNRRPELAGYYHPSKPWRCIGSGYTSDGLKIDYVVKNLKPVGLQRRVLLARNPIGFSGSAASTVLAVFKVLARGGRIAVRLVGNSATVSNSGANTSTLNVTASFTDEYGAGPAAQSLGKLTCNASGNLIEVPSSSFMAEIGEMTGMLTVNVTATLTAGAGTPTGTITAVLEVWEIF